MTTKPGFVSLAMQRWHLSAPHLSENAKQVVKKNQIDDFLLDFDMCEFPEPCGGVVSRWDHRTSPHQIIKQAKGKENNLLFLICHPSSRASLSSDYLIQTEYEINEGARARKFSNGEKASVKYFRR